MELHYRAQCEEEYFHAENRQAALHFMVLITSDDEIVKIAFQELRIFKNRMDID